MGTAGSGPVRTDALGTTDAGRATLTLQMGPRRFTRLTNASSKKVENHAHSVAVHTMHYNFVDIRQTLRCKPPMLLALPTNLGISRYCEDPGGVGGSRLVF